MTATTSYGPRKELIFHRLLRRVIQRSGDELGFVDDANGHLATFAGHADRVFRLVGVLRGLGVSPGDRFAVLAGNSYRYMELWHAALLGGGVINPINARLAPPELGAVLADSGARVCFVDAALAGTLEAAAPAPALTAVRMQPHAAGDGSYEDLLARASPHEPPEAEEADPVALIYTGGTTGAPKGVLIDQRAAILSQYHTAMSSPRGRGVQLILAPLFHGGALGAVVGGAGFGIRSVFQPSFEPGALMDAIERHAVTVTGMVPTMISMLLEHPEFRPERLASLRYLAYGAAPISEVLLERLRVALPHVELFQGYGVTESSSVLTLLGADEHRKGGPRLKSVGRALPGVGLTVQGPDGTVLPPGGIGEVCARGGNFMVEYWQRPRETAEAFRNGWYHTGDIGYLDPEGYLYLLDRIDDLIVTGGENVYSTEVEAAIASHPAVAQVAVVGIPDERWGESVLAIVVPDAASSVTEQEIIDHARRSLGGFKVPRNVVLRRQPLPISGAMKVLKRQLREPYWEHGRGSDL